MDKYRISIVTVVYNGVESIENTILSVINQTYDNIEYIIIDGGSTDGTQDVIKKYGEKISYWVSEPDKGIYDAMNKGIDIASGDWVNFMNCGDFFFKNDTVEQIGLNLDESINIIYGDVLLRFKDDDVDHLSSAINYENVIYKNPFCHQSVFVSSVLMKMFKFDLKYKHSADYNFFLEVFKKNVYQYKKVLFPISIYDMHGVSNSSIALREYVNIAFNHYPYSWIFLYHYFKFIIFVIKSKLKIILPHVIVSKLSKYPI